MLVSLVRVNLPIRRRDRALRGVVLQVPPHRRPVLAPMDRVDPVRGPHPRAVLLLAVRRLERQIRVAEDDLAEVARAVLDVAREPGAVRRHPDADDVEAVSWAS